MWDPFAEFESATLPNGLRVYAAEWPNRPWQAMGFLIHSGAAQDPIGLEGLAHYTEHLVSENASMPLKDIEAFFQAAGGFASFGSTSFSSTNYKFFAPKQKKFLEEALILFGTMLLKETLKNRVEAERAVILQEFSRKYPVQFVFDFESREQQMVFPG